MYAVHHLDPSSFRARTHAFLHAREAERSMLLGNTLSPRIEQAGARLVTVEQASEIVALAVLVPARPLLVDGVSDPALRLLAEDLRATDPVPERVFGPSHAACVAAESLAPGRAQLERHQRLHVLTQVAALPPPPGILRRATADEIDLLVDWNAGFVRDVGLSDKPPARDDVAWRIDEGSLFVWDHAGPRAMAASVRPTTTTTTIGFVYTPAEERGRGYATACVAALSSRLLAQGRACCLLFTDLANPVSNAIYGRIGYRPLADFDEWRCEPA